MVLLFSDAPSLGRQSGITLGALHSAAPELAAAAWGEGFEAQVQVLHYLLVWELSVPLHVL